MRLRIAQSRVRAAPVGRAGRRQSLLAAFLSLGCVAARPRPRKAGHGRRRSSVASDRASTSPRRPSIAAALPARTRVGPLRSGAADPARQHAVAGGHARIPRTHAVRARGQRAIAAGRSRLGAARTESRESCRRWTWPRHARDVAGRLDQLPAPGVRVGEAGVAGDAALAARAEFPAAGRSRARAGRSGRIAHPAAGSRPAGRLRARLATRAGVRTRASPWLRDPVVCVCGRAARDLRRAEPRER